MAFRKYRKIHRLGAEENEGILIGKCAVQEKIDGANTSVWFEDGFIRCGTRTQIINGGDKDTFNGFLHYVQTEESFKKIFAAFPTLRLYGEWLVRHTISYKETAYRQWYLFDYVDRDSEEIKTEGEDRERSRYAYPDEVYTLAETFGFKTPKLFGIFENPTIDQIKGFVGQTDLGDKGEGVVIKNFDFVNKFGDQEYAKIVTEDFKENNAIVFGGNNKHSDNYWEMYVVNKYMTLPRIQKIMNKIQPTVDRRLGMPHTARIIQTAYHDLITEEAWEIQKKCPKIDFKILSRVATRKAAQIYHDILNDSISVADQ